MMKTTAQDIMSTELLTIQEGDSLEEALKILLNNRITGMPVVNKAQELVGVVSEYDLMLQISEMVHPEKADLSVVFKYSHEVTAIPSTTDLNDIIKMFIEMKYRRLPVVDAKKKLVGIITRRDLMKLFYYRSRLA
jgi:CBS domain-containing protein